MSTEFELIPKSEINNRISNLTRKLNEDEIDGALFLSTTETYYYSGIGIGGAIFIPTEGNPIRLVERNLPLAKSHSQIMTILPLGRLSKIFDQLEISQGSCIAVESDLIPNSLLQFLKSKAEGIEFIDGSMTFRNIRAIKSAFEIDRIADAAALIDQSLEYCREIAKPEMTEIELSSKLSSWLLGNGHDGFITTRAFNSHLLQYAYVTSSGASMLNAYFTPISGLGLSLMYPYGPSRQKLGHNRPFIVDSCGNSRGYISDTTRTFVCGHFDHETQTQLEALRQIKELLHRVLKPGANLGDIYQAVLHLANDLGIGNNFMGDEADQVSFIGHGVGLELDDLPILYAKGPDLVTGNVLACEPKYVEPGKKVLGIEDTYAITESHNTLLSQAPAIFEI